MARKDKLTQEELAVIVGHVQPLLDGVIASLDNLPERGEESGSNYVREQRQYFKHARGVLRWVLGVAKQRAKNAGQG